MWFYIYFLKKTNLSTMAKEQMINFWIHHLDSERITISIYFIWRHLSGHLTAMMNNMLKK